MDRKKHFPRVLVFGTPFHTSGGGGIMLVNIYKDWPDEKLAIAAYKLDKESFKYGRSLYRLGFDENRRPWPFYLFQRKQISGPISVNENSSDSGGINSLNQKNYKESGLKKFFLKLRHFLGIYYFIYRLRVSKRFLDWIDEVQPDIIYAQLSDLDSIRFITQLLKLRKIPLAIHIMDDWPLTLKEPGLLYYYWKGVIDKKFRGLLDKASLLMSICQEMSDEYLVRYGKEFIPFLNTVDIDRWDKHSRKNWDFTGDFKILYAGRIGRGTSNSIITIMQAVEILSGAGYRLVFELQTKHVPDEIRSEMQHCKHTAMGEFIAYDNLPAKFASADLLVLPMDFDKYNLDFIHLSMPTKVPEYLATGTPILVFASETTAMYKYASRMNWGYTVKENNIEAIEDAIQHIYENKKLREELGTRGKMIARAHHSGVEVREEFRKTLNNAIKI